MKAFTACTLVLLAACGKDSAGIQASKIHLAVISGDLQVDTVAQQLAEPITAKATDSATTKPVAGVIVNWFRVTGTDSVFIGAGSTSDSGFARYRPTLATKSGAQTIVAWALDNAGRKTVYAAAAATALPGPPTAFAMVPDQLVARSADDTIRVAYGFFDQYNNRTACDEFGYGLNIQWFPYPQPGVGSQQIGTLPIQYIGTISPGPSEAPSYEARFIPYGFTGGSTSFWVWARPRCLTGTYKDDFNPGPPAHGADSLTIGLSW